MDITTELRLVLETLLAAPEPLPARAVPMTARQVEILLDEKLAEAIREGGKVKYKLTEDGVFFAEHLYSLLPVSPSYDVMHAPIWNPPEEVPVRPGALDFKRIPSHGACVKESK